MKISGDDYTTLKTHTHPLAANSMEITCRTTDTKKLQMYIIAGTYSYIKRTPIRHSAIEGLK